MKRWKIVDGYIRLRLIPYIGNIQIAHVGQDKWNAYALWRKQDGKNKGRKQSDGTVREATPAKNGTIRSETAIFRAIVNFAADKQYIRERQVPKGKLLQDKAGRGVHAAGIRRPSYLRARMDLRIRDEVLSLVADDGLQLHARHGQYGNAAAGSENPSLARLRQAAAHAGKS